jgi:hypothetical protein
MEGVEGDPQWGSFNGQKSEEELADEEQDDKTILQVALRPPPFSTALKMNFPELCRKFRCSSFPFCFSTSTGLCIICLLRVLQSLERPALFLPPLEFLSPYQLCTEIVVLRHSRLNCVFRVRLKNGRIRSRYLSPYEYRAGVLILCSTIISLFSSIFIRLER